MSGLTWPECYELVKLLRIDVFFLFCTLGSFIPIVTLNQLAQDKYCLNKYGFNESICLSLENAGPQFDQLRNRVLQDATELQMYCKIVTTTPGIFFSFFLGYWIDTYPAHLRYLLGSAAMSTVLTNLIIIYQTLSFQLDPTILLIAAMVPAFTGSGLIVSIGAFTYATLKTPPKYRAVRFTILEVFMFVAIPISAILVGSTLSMTPWFTGQHRNYIGVFILASFFSLLAALWVLFMLTDADNERSPPASRYTKEMSTIKGLEEQKESLKEHGPEGEEKSGMVMIRDIIDFRSSLKTFQTVFKRRANNVHLSLLLIMYAAAIVMVVYMADHSVGFQFTQKVYRWNAEKLSYMSSLIIVFPALGTVLGPPIFIHYFGLHDSTVGIIGCFSLISAFTIKGLILDEIAYFAAIIGCFSALLPITNRSIVSRMITNQEVGQIYAFLSSIETMGPLIASTVFSKVFNLTIGTNPGLVYLLAAFLTLQPLAISFWLFVTKEKWDLSFEVGVDDPKSIGDQAKQEISSIGMDTIDADASKQLVESIQNDPVHPIISVEP